MSQTRPLDVIRNGETLIPKEPEIWRTVDRYPFYSVSSHGRVRRDAVVRGGGGSIRNPSGFLKQRSLPLGHRQITLSMNNIPVTVLVHRLVAEAFLPTSQPEKDCVCHRDDDPSNNYYENLFYGTRRDNMADMCQKGRQARGSAVAGSKLDAAAVKRIRGLAARGANQRDIAAEFGVTQSNVSQIISGKTWGHVT